MKGYLTTNPANIVTRLVALIKIAAWSPELPVDEKRLHFSNGTYNLADKSFSTEKSFCQNRLPVRYVEDVPKPERLLSFLDEMLYENDDLAINHNRLVVNFFCRFLNVSFPKGGFHCGRWEEDTVYD